ncbi:MAG: YegS/Rv2252/BmrU family lipid kinase, partial [Planctomycetes bacterium]|nr:YegS/Rv2252/BmrU family lipid kinase [Planctomycetota bacterium]
MSTSKRFLVIVNDRAGRCALQADLEARLRAALAPAEVELLRSEDAQDAEAATARARQHRYDAVIMVGGDGTHHGVLDVLAGGEVPLGLIPLGTANDLAAEHGIPQDLEAACEIIREGCRTTVDLIRTKEKTFATAGGLGLCTDVALGVCEARQRSWLFHAFMRLVGGLIYQLYLVYRVLFAKRLDYRFTLTDDTGRARDLDAYMLLFMNQAFLGSNFRAAPQASNRDGVLDVIVVKKLPGRRFERLQLLRTVATCLKGKHIGRPDVEVIRAQKVEVTATEPVAFFADGELVAKTDRYTFKTLRRALPLLVPKERAIVARVPRRSNLGDWSADRRWDRTWSVGGSQRAPRAA